MVGAVGQGWAWFKHSGEARPKMQVAFGNGDLAMVDSAPPHMEVSQFERAGGGVSSISWLRAQPVHAAGRALQLASCVIMFVYGTQPCTCACTHSCGDARTGIYVALTGQLRDVVIQSCRYARVECVTACAAQGEPWAMAASAHMAVAHRRASNPCP